MVVTSEALWPEGGVLVRVRKGKRVSLREKECLQPRFKNGNRVAINHINIMHSEPACLECIIPIRGVARNFIWGAGYKF